MANGITKNTTLALASGGDFRAVARFNSARSANKVSLDTTELATKGDIKREIESIRKDIALSEERTARKIYHAALLAVGINGTIVAALFVIFEFLR